MAEVVRQTARIKKDAWFLRLYLWMWRADAREVDFCRMFWGYVFATPNLLIRLSLSPLWLLFHVGRRAARVLGVMLDKIPERQRPVSQGPIFSTSPPDRPATKKKPKSDRLGGFLKAAARVGDSMVAGGQRIWPYIRWCLYAVGVLFGLAVGVFTGWLLYLLYTAFDDVAAAVEVAAAGTWLGLRWFAELAWDWGWLVGLVVLGLTGFWVLLAAARTPFGRRLGTRVSEPLATGTIGFFEVLAGGAKAVKYRTCPIIEVVDDE